MSASADPRPLPDVRERSIVPPGLSFWGKVGFWLKFWLLVKTARLRFLAILVAIGAVITQWDTLVNYYEKWTRPAASDHAAAGDFEWFCPMHPAVVRDHPKDKCPICFMPLSKRKKGDVSDEPLPAGIVSRVQLSPYRVVLGGIRTWPVEPLPLTKEITTVGYVEFNERGLKHVAARVKGRIDKLFVNETGRMVHAGDELAELYSPELVVTVQNLLDARRSGGGELERGARERLRLWGIDDAQTDEILRSGRANTHLKIRSPISGHVLKKYVREGQYVEEGAGLYDVTDLSTVWVQAQVYEDETVFLRAAGQAEHGRFAGGEGLPATATTRSSPGESFHGKLAFIFPHVDQETRTLTVRFEVDNPGHKLRPGTSATVTLRVPPARLELLTRTLAEDAARRIGLDMLVRAPSIEALLRTAGQRALLASGRVLAVPEGAVIDTGSQKVVYREATPGVYEGVRVELGPRMAGTDGVTCFPVLHGLEAGDRVVTAGSFLVDAETRLNPAAGSIYYGGSGGSKSGTSATVRPSTPEDEDAKVKAVLAKLSADDRRLVEQQGSCPILGSRLGSMGPPVKIVLDGHPVFLCCKGCEAKAKANPAAMLEKVRGFRDKQTPASPPPAEPGLTAQEEADIRAELAKLSPEERRLAEVQRMCPITGERLGSMGKPMKVMIDGQPVYLCCRGCNEQAIKDGAKTLGKVKELKAKGARRSAP